jgi:TPP-dependent indolepyruvate ferredoxin oxidoreductase alpha subunit
MRPSLSIIIGTVYRFILTDMLLLVSIFNYYRTRFSIQNIMEYDNRTLDQNGFVIVQGENMNKILQGNEAIARGAWESGVVVGSAYPGTPSSEIMAELSSYREIYTEWAPNEKVAVEVAHGASLAGGRAVACMKHVGLNVAADPFMTIAYTGIKGGFVIVVADDPPVSTARKTNRTAGDCRNRIYHKRWTPATMIDYEQLVRAIGVKNVRKVDPYKLNETIDVIKEEVARDDASVIITENSPCMLLRRANPLDKFKYKSHMVDIDMCRGCKTCLEINCPAMSWQENSGQTKDGHKRKGTVYINEGQCVSCEVCAQICKFEAIVPGAK